MGVNAPFVLTLISLCLVLVAAWQTKHTTAILALPVLAVLLYLTWV